MHNLKEVTVQVGSFFEEQLSALYLFDFKHQKQTGLFI